MPGHCQSSRIDDVKVLKRVAIHLSGYDIRFFLVAIVPTQIHNRVGVGTSLLLVQLPYPLEKADHHVQVRYGLSGRFHRFVAPLHPAAAVGYAAFFLKGAGCREQEDLSLDVRGIHTSLGSIPEGVGLIEPDVAGHHPLQFLQGVPCA